MSGSSCFAILPIKQTKAESYYLLGLLNSELLEFFHKVKASTFIYAGRYRYWMSHLKDYPIIDCCLEQPKLERRWLEIESQVSDVCDLVIRNGNLVCGATPVYTAGEVPSTSLFRFALQKEIASLVGKILGSDSNQLNGLEQRLNSLVFHLYRINDSLKDVARNALMA